MGERVAGQSRVRILSVGGWGEMRYCYRGGIGPIASGLNCWACMPCVTWNQWVCLPKNYLVSFGRSKITWDVGHRVYTESPVSVARSTWDRLAIPWMPGWRSISSTSIVNIQTSQPLQNTASTWNTAFNFIIPPSSPLRPNIWIASLVRPLKLSSITTIWTERWVFVSASHGNPSSAPSKTLPNMTPDLQGYTGHARSAV
jgi:hypothetical protein